MRPESESQGDVNLQTEKTSDRQRTDKSTMEEPPLKRQKVEDEDKPTKVPERDIAAPRYIRETDVGITEFINRDHEGFDCVLKYRCPHSPLETYVDTLTLS
jgi:hypothetical protein